MNLNFLKTINAVKNNEVKMNADFVELIKGLEKCAPNKTLWKKIKAFLLECGVTAECIEKIVSIIKK